MNAQLRELIAFLLGEGPLDGRWFGDEHHTTECGPTTRYWWRQLLRAAALAAPKEAGADIDAMVNRFLGWKLPANFSPDAGISFTPYDPPQYPQMREHCWPIGTNLLTATQAKAMLQYVLATAPQDSGGTLIHDHTTARTPTAPPDISGQIPANPPGDQRQEGAVCDQWRPGAPCLTPASCRVNGCDAVERELFPPPEAAAAVGDGPHEALRDELLDLSEWPFNAECCNSQFPINMLRRICKEAAAALASPTGVDEAARLMDEAMDMQEKRESGEFHLTAPAARHVWNAARAAYRAVRGGG